MRNWLESKTFWVAASFLGLYAGVLWSVFPEFWVSPDALIQDDGRHFVAWLRQMAEPGLFPNDPIADYWHSLTPAAYKWLYLPAVLSGLDVVTWQYLFVVPLACLLLALSIHALSSLLVRNPVYAGFLTLLLANIMAETVTVGLPRSFGYAIVLFALTAFLQSRRGLLSASCLLGAAIYPVSAIVACVTIGMVVLLGWVSDRDLDRTRLMSMLVAGGSAVLGLMIFLSGATESGPAITLAEASKLPIFSEGGRTDFFRATLTEQVLCAGRSGLLPNCIDVSGSKYPLLSILATIAVLMLGAYAYGRITRDDPVRRRQEAYRLSLALILAGVSLFAAAYFVAFNAHLPSKYTFLSVTLVYHLSLVCMVLALAGALGNFLRTRITEKVVSRMQAGLFLLAWLGLLVHAGGGGDINRDSEPAISSYLKQTPMDTVVAGTPRYVDNIPAFAGRPVFVSLELLIPYKRDYYHQMAQRVTTLHDIYRSAFGAEFAALVGQSGIDYFVIAHNPADNLARWRKSFPVLTELAGGNIFTSTPSATRDCTVVRGRKHDLVDAACLMRLAGNS